MFTVLKATYLRMMSWHSHSYFHNFCIFQRACHFGRVTKPTMIHTTKVYTTPGGARVPIYGRTITVTCLHFGLCTASANELRVKTGIKEKSRVVGSALLYVYGSQYSGYSVTAWNYSTWMIIDRQLRPKPKLVMGDIVTVTKSKHSFASSPVFSSTEDYYGRER